MLIEYIRVTEFPHKPSRFSACYVFSNMDDAVFYLKHCSQTSILYEVAIIDNTKHHKGCFNTLPSIGHTVKGVQGNPEKTARNYWLGEKTAIANYEHLNCHEILIESPIKILSKID